MVLRPSRLVPAACLIALGAAQAPARAEDIKIEIPGERSNENKILLASMGGVGLVLGALGVYWHLDSRSASDDASADKFTGHAWTADDQALVDRADRSRTRAIMAYSAGGVLLVGAAIVYIVTEPKSETAIIHPHGRGTPTVAPTEGGAVLGGMWSF